MPCTENFSESSSSAIDAISISVISVELDGDIAVSPISLRRFTTYLCVCVIIVLFRFDFLLSKREKCVIEIGKIENFCFFKKNHHQTPNHHINPNILIYHYFYLVNNEPRCTTQRQKKPTATPKNIEKPIYLMASIHSCRSRSLST